MVASLSGQLQCDYFAAWDRSRAHAAFVRPLLRPARSTLRENDATGSCADFTRTAHLGDGGCVAPWTSGLVRRSPVGFTRPSALTSTLGWIPQSPVASANPVALILVGSGAHCSS